MRLLLILTLGLLDRGQGLPNNIKSSIQQVLESLQEQDEWSSRPVLLVEENQRIRPKIITKYDFMRRDRSSELPMVPQPMVVSAGLTVTEQKETDQSSSTGNRRGRNLNLQHRAPRARVNFAGLGAAVEIAPVIHGVRVPDDETDRIVHRNGRFINNVFVPDDVEIDLPEYTITSEIVNKDREELRRNGRSDWSEENRIDTQFDDRSSRNLPFNFNFESFYAGRKQDMADAMALESRTNEVYVKPNAADSHIYYLEEEPDSLHADRSPYTFEPADTRSRFSSPPANILQATNEDFEIKEHSYQMCPGCPTFNIPIPVPKSSLYSGDLINPYNEDPGFEYKHDPAESVVDIITNKIMDTITPVFNTARSWFTKEPASNAVHQTQGFSDRLSSLPAEKSDMSPLMFASVAAVGLGVATVISSGLQLFAHGGLGGRQFGEENSNLRQDDEVLNQLEGMDYNPGDVKCLARDYCEKMKRNKNMLDGFENTKKVGLWIVERIFNKDIIYKKGEPVPFYNQCHLRECIFSLLS